MNNLSAPQFGDSGSQMTGQMFQQHAETPAPLSLSTATRGSGNARTAWTNKSLSGNTPLSLSSHTEGTTYKFDDNQTSLPSIKE